MSEDRTFAQSLSVVPAEETVPALTVEAFRSGRPGYIEAIGAGEMSLPAVSCYGTSARDVEIQRPLNMPVQPPGFLTSVRYPRLVISRLNNAVCLAGGIALDNKRRILLESFSAPWEADYHNALERDGSGWRLRQKVTMTSQLDAPALFVDYQHSSFFGHFIADSLSRCWAVDFCRVWLGLGIHHVLSTAPVPEFIVEFLQAIGVTVVPLAAGQSVICRELIVATKGFQIQEYTSPPVVSLWQRLRDRLAVPGAWPARVYISRRRNPTRKLLEEEQVEAVFAQHGFTIFHPEEHGIATQVSVFAAARFIAGCSGSNMFNIAFQSRAEAILILVSPLLVHYSEHFLAAGGGAKLSYFLGYVTEAQLELTPGYVHAPWHVDLPRLERCVEDWIAGTT